jgi:hypothetical protein
MKYCIKDVLPIDVFIKLLDISLDNWDKEWFL